MTDAALEARAREVLAKQYDYGLPARATHIRGGRSDRKAIDAMLAFAAEVVARERAECARRADYVAENHAAQQATLELHGASAEVVDCGRRVAEAIAAAIRQRTVSEAAQDGLYRDGRE